MPDDAVLEPGALDELLEAGGDDAAFVATLLQEFAGEAPGLLAALRDAVARGDGEAAAGAAHTLRSNAAIFGARRLRAVCADLETRARAGELRPGEPLVGAIEHACAEAQAHLAARLAT